MQFGVSGAAVARAWADKILDWVLLHGDTSAQARFWGKILDPLPSMGFSPLAAALQGACVLVLMRGAKVGKRITTVLTLIKVTTLFDFFLVVLSFLRDLVA